MSKSVKEEIQAIKKDIAYLKQHMIDEDSILSEEDYAALLDCRTEKEQGKLISEKQLRKELGLDVPD